nr:MAG TPA: hypothetical protein [Caudoviricetes sp.]
MVSVSKVLLRKGVEKTPKRNINLIGRLIHAPKIKKPAYCNYRLFSHETKMY